MKIKSAVILAAILIITVFISVFGLCHLDLGQYETVPLTELLLSAQDTDGSIYAVYELSDGEDVDRAVEIIQERIKAYGMTSDYKAYRFGDQIRIEAAISSSALTNITSLVAPEHFEFVDAEGNVLVDGDHIISAEVKPYGGTNYYYIEYQFDEEGTQAYYEATSALIGSKMDIQVDGTALYGDNAPTVSEAVSDGKGYIEGTFTRKAAQQMATTMRMGSLPEMTRVRQGTLTATLGENAYSALFAGVLAAVGVAVLALIVLYGMNGIIAALSTAICLLVYLFVEAMLGLRMSLAGFTGVALSLVYLLAVNWVSLAYIKRGLRRIAVVQEADKLGFSQTRMFAFDAGVALFVGAVAVGALVDAYFGWALGVGVLLAFLSGVLLTPALCRLVCQAGLNDRRLYGVIAKKEA